MFNRYLIVNKNGEFLITLDFKSQLDFKLKRKWAGFDELARIVIVPFEKLDEVRDILLEYGLIHMRDYNVFPISTK